MVPAGTAAIRPAAGRGAAEAGTGTMASPAPRTASTTGGSQTSAAPPATGGTNLPAQAIAAGARTPPASGDARPASLPVRPGGEPTVDGGGQPTARIARHGEPVRATAVDRPPSPAVAGRVAELPGSLQGEAVSPGGTAVTTAPAMPASSAVAGAEVGVQAVSANIPSTTPDSAVTLAAVERLQPAEIVERVRELVVERAAGGRTELRLELDPPSLGHVRLRIAQAGPGLRVQLTVGNQAAARALEQELSGMTHGLARLGTVVEEITVRVAELGGAARHEHAGGEGGRPQHGAPPEQGTGEQAAGGRGQAGAGGERSAGGQPALRTPARAGGVAGEADGTTVSTAAGRGLDAAAIGRGGAVDVTA
jgi:flagellar hook-length control protein FliK